MTIKPEHDEHLKASIDAAAKKMPAYSLKPQLVQALVDAVVEANNAQAASPSQAQLILAFHLILKDWAVHPIPAYNDKIETKQKKVDALFRELLDAVIDQHRPLPGNETEVIKIAKELCRNAIGSENDINHVVMGFENMTVPITGKNKRLVSLVYPLKPLWTHYIQDAINALAAIEKVREEKKDAVPRLR